MRFVKCLFLIVILFSINSSIYAVSPNSSIQSLDNDLKNFRRRIFIYRKCLSNHCNPQEQEKVKQAVLKDIKKIIAILVIIGAMGSGFIIFKKYGLPILEEKIEERLRERAKRNPNAILEIFFPIYYIQPFL